MLCDLKKKKKDKFDLVGGDSGSRVMTVEHYLSTKSQETILVWSEISKVVCTIKRVKKEAHRPENTVGQKMNDWNQTGFGKWWGIEMAYSAKYKNIKLMF